MGRRFTGSSAWRLALDALTVLGLTWMVGAPHPVEYRRTFHAAPNAAPEIRAGRDAFAERALSQSPLGQAYDAALAEHPNLTYPRLASELGLTQPADPPLSFQPASLPFYSRVAGELQLTPEEARVFSEHGVVSIDHEQRYSMGSAYYAIYARDLPVLITTDSILHALHRSYDAMLKELEGGLLIDTLSVVLKSTHDELVRRAPELASAGLAENVSDLDVYLSVARSLLRGAGAPKPAPDALPVDSGLGQRARVRALLDAIAKLELQRPDADAPTVLYGGRRYIDYSQFRPRGHYLESEPLQRYFRALMWLGRGDLGFTLDAPDRGSGLQVNLERERRDAALLALLIRDAKQLGRLRSVSEIIDFLVGRSDDVTVAQMSAAAEAAGVTRWESLRDPASLPRIREQLAKVASHQQIRSRVQISTPKAPGAPPAPQSLQLFGQRFMLDSFVLSRVAFDSIEFEGKKPRRMLPTGLDVMAAFGNDEALRLLRPELEKYDYSSNLLAVRRALESEPKESWKGDLVSLWLDALRTLDDAPHSRNFPEVMARVPWQRKQLQTQLASWAELRHDTLLYAKQSYTSFPSCGYPSAYVEPYPEFYARLASLAERGARFLADGELLKSESNPSPELREVRDRQIAFFHRFSKTLRTLERLSNKELRAEPFTPEEQGFLEKTIDSTGGGSGPPRYDGWYPRLIYRKGLEAGAELGDYSPKADSPDAWKPTVADVHTSPGGLGEPARVLEAGVGDVEFLLVAIDNQRDRAVYVGPVYSYYEFTEDPQRRLTDEAWQQRVASRQLPPRPAFSDVFRAPSLARELGLSRSGRYHGNPTSERLKAKIRILSILEEEESQPRERARWLAFRERAEALLLESDKSPGFQERLEQLPVSLELEARLEALHARPFDHAVARTRLKSAAASASERCGSLATRASLARVTLTFTSPDGVVSDVEFEDEKLRETSLAKCLQSWFQRLTAPRFAGGPVKVPIRVPLAAPHSP